MSTIDELMNDVDHYSLVSDLDPRQSDLFNYFATVAPRNQDEWIFIPQSKEETKLTFYAFYKSDRALRSFLELAKACIGGELLRGVRIKVCNQRDINAFVEKMYTHGFIKYQEIVIDISNSFAMKRLERLRRIIENTHDVAQDSGLIIQTDIQRFRVFLQNRDLVAAEEILNQIIATGRLSSVNKNFLKLQLKQKMGRNHEIWNDQSINEVVVALRPRIVTEFLLESLWDYTRESLVSGDIAKIDQVIIDYMKRLSSSVKVPQTPQGRICAAISIAIRGGDVEQEMDLKSLEREEVDHLIHIGKMRNIPRSLLQFQNNFPLGELQPDFKKIDSSGILPMAIEMNELGDVRGLIALLSHAKSIDGSPDGVMKNIVRLVASDMLVEWAPGVLNLLSQTDFKTESWSRTLKRDIAKIGLMASTYGLGFEGLTKHASTLFEGDGGAYQILTAQECLRAWSIDCFADKNLDSVFADWVSSSGFTRHLRGALDDLSNRLQESGLGPASCIAILGQS